MFASTRFSIPLYLNLPMKPDSYTTEAVLRVGEVIEVSGRRIFVRVDRNKNASDLFFDGQLLRNVSVNGYVELRKGFLTLIGKVESLTKKGKLVAYEAVVTNGKKHSEIQVGPDGKKLAKEQ